MGSRRDAPAGRRVLPARGGLRNPSSMDGSLASLGPSVERSGEPARPRFPPVGERLQQPLTLVLLPANDDPSPRKAPDSRRPGRRALRRPLWSPAAPTSPSLVCALCRRFRALDCCWHPGPWRRQTRGVRRGCWIEANLFLETSTGPCSKAVGASTRRRRRGCRVAAACATCSHRRTLPAGRRCGTAQGLYVPIAPCEK